MSKRKLEDLEEYLELDGGEPIVATAKPTFKNSLDSDEEDDEAKEETHYVMHENDIEGVEEGPSAPETNVGFTAFNMKEELEEGHFDKEGHYHWKKEKEIRDNWLDNIDWLKVENKPGDDSKKDEDSDEDTDFLFDPIPLYKQILEYLKPGESVSKALCRLGRGKRKLTTAERWKKKKDPNAVIDDDENSINITKLTELANQLLTRTGNMDIYQETYDQINKKVSLAQKYSHPSKVEAELDMFSDEFSSKEQDKIVDTKTDESTAQKSDDGDEKEDPGVSDVSWEFKWSQEEKAEIHGPHTSEQMHTWAKDGYFKKGAWVRKIGQNSEFFNAARIDFELYL